MKKALSRYKDTVLNEASRQYGIILSKVVVTVVGVALPKVILQNLFHYRVFDSTNGNENAMACTNFGKLYFESPRVALYEDVTPDADIWVNRIRACVSFVQLNGIWAFTIASRTSDKYSGGKRIADSRVAIIAPFWKGRKLDDFISSTMYKNQTGELATVFWDGKQWIYGTPVKRRMMSEIAMTDAVRVDFFEDAKDWWAKRDWYTRIHVPFRRGYLLVGLTGSGKTTMAPVLATELGLDKIFSLSLANHTDQSLMMAVQGIHADSIVVIEDADSFRALREDHDETSKEPILTRAGVLNAIGGLTSSDGRVLIMTANTNPFTDAVTRPDRIDVTIIIDQLSGKNIHDYVVKLFPEYTFPDASQFISTTAAVMQGAIAKFCDSEIMLIKALTGSLGKTMTISTEIDFSEPARNLLPKLTEKDHITPPAEDVVESAEDIARDTDGWQEFEKTLDILNESHSVQVLRAKSSKDAPADYRDMIPTTDAVYVCTGDVDITNSLQLKALCLRHKRVFITNLHSTPFLKTAAGSEKLVSLLISTHRETGVEFIIIWEGGEDWVRPEMIHNAHPNEEYDISGYLAKCSPVAELCQLQDYGFISTIVDKPNTSKTNRGLTAAQKVAGGTKVALLDCQSLGAEPLKVIHDTAAATSNGVIVLDNLNDFEIPNGENFLGVDRVTVRAQLTLALLEAHYQYGTKFVLIIHANTGIALLSMTKQVAYKTIQKRVIDLDKMSYIKVFLGKPQCGKTTKACAWAQKNYGNSIKILGMSGWIPNDHELAIMAAAQQFRCIVLDDLSACDAIKTSADWLHFIVLLYGLHLKYNTHFVLVWQTKT